MAMSIYPFVHLSSWGKILRTLRRGEVLRHGSGREIPRPVGDRGSINWVWKIGSQKILGAIFGYFWCMSCSKVQDSTHWKMGHKNVFLGAVWWRKAGQRRSSSEKTSPFWLFDRLRTGSHGPSNSMIYILTMAVYHGKLLVITKGCPHFSWL